MLIEQINKLELRRPRPHGRTYIIVHFTPKIGYFHDETKTSMANLQIKSFTAKNITESNAPCFYPLVPSHLQNLTQKCKILRMFWTWPASEGKTEQFNFLIGFQILKILFFQNSNGIKTPIFPKNYKQFGTFELH